MVINRKEINVVNNAPARGSFAKTEPWLLNWSHMLEECY